MRSATLAGLLVVVGAATAQTTGKLGNAPVIKTNPAGAKYRAILDSADVHGSVSALSDTIGVNYTIGLHQLPVEKGPFSTYHGELLCAPHQGVSSANTLEEYHIHVNPVPANGSCAATGGHLDPYQRGDTPACNDTAPATCQVGDLSGKYGIIIGPSALKM